MPADPWSPERIALLEKLWTEGASAQSIAGRLGGVSRAAVLGKIFRLRRDAAGPGPRAVTPAQQTLQRANAKHVDTALPVRRRRGDPREAPREGQSWARTRGKSLLELGNESCRWPHGCPGSARFHFCGAPGADLENGMPYCPQHAARAYLKHPSFSESPQASAADAQRTGRPDSRQQYVWRALVRHPAARWK